MSNDGPMSYVPPSDEDDEDEDRDDREHVVFIEDPKPRRK